MAYTRVAKKIEQYQRAYYDEQCILIGQYAGILDALPRFLRTTCRVEAHLSTGGVVILHYPASTFQFYCWSTSEPIDRITRQVTRGIIEIERGSRQLHLDIADIEIRRHDGSVHWKPEWCRAQILIPFKSSHWTRELGRANARSEFLSFVTAHLMNLRESDVSRVRDLTIQRLSHAIRDFRSLLDSANREEEIQLFLEQHPYLLDPLALEIRPKVKLGSEYISDFVIIKPNSEYVLVEIEQPRYPLFTKRGDPSQYLSHAERQVQDWLTWVQDNIAYARNIFPGVVSSHAWVVIGRRSSLSRDGERLLVSRNSYLHRITIKTYDHLIETAEVYLNSLMRLATDHNR